MKQKNKLDWSECMVLRNALKTQHGYVTEKYKKKLDKKLKRLQKEYIDGTRRQDRVSDS